MTHTENAWPFLIGRSRNAGYRVVVVPDFMEDAASTNALSGATGAVNLPADAASVRELRGLASGPVSIVYRSFNPRGDDFGLGDRRGELTDGFGRMIRVAEGFVVRRTVGEAAPLEVGLADLERAHAEVAGAYREFWEQDRAYVRRTSGAYPLGTAADRSAKPVHLVAAAPWSREPVPAGSPPLSLHSPVFEAADEPSARQAAPRRTRQVTTAAVVVVGLAVVGGVAAYELRGKPAASTTASTTSVLGNFCRALTAGQPDTAYGYTDAQFQTTVSSSVFTQEVLSGAKQASQCTYTVGPATASTANGTITVSVSNGQATATAWSVTLTREQDASWLISTLTVATGKQ
jgi:hypothetical protein